MHKVFGMANLLEVTPTTTSIVAFSSSSGALGSPGQATYAAANTILDGYCQSPSGPRKLASVQWGGWQAGMTDEYGIVAVRGERFMRTELGLSALALAAVGSSMVVDITNWQHYARSVGFRTACVAPLVVSAAAKHDSQAAGSRVPLPSDAECAEGTDEWQWLLDHTDQHGPLLPATAIVQLLLTAGGPDVAGEMPPLGLGQLGNAPSARDESKGARSGHGDRDLVGLTQVRFTSPLRLGPDVSVVRAHDSVALLSVAPDSAAAAAATKTHAHALLQRNIPSTAANVLANADLASCREVCDVSRIYDELAAGEFVFRRACRRVRGRVCRHV